MGENRPNRIEADNPITKEKDDTLGRTEAARSFAKQILALDTSEGVVVGVLGPWGSGKTSFINLACNHLRESKATVLDFNPWMFSGADQLVLAFFGELSAQLKLRGDLAEIGAQVEDYGEAFSGLGWVPVVGTWLERGRVLIKILGKFLKNKKGGVGVRRAKIHSTLSKLSSPIVVIVDDIDRLTASEIRDMFKLVRLTASFPNVIYILAFDRARVEAALGEQGIPGRDYLEKILQIGIDLPAIPFQVLSSQVWKAIEKALHNVPTRAHFDESIWLDVFTDVIRPLVRNMRDVRRYSIAIRGTALDLGGQVSLLDLLALEAVRVFLPDVFMRIHTVVDGLTKTANGLGGREESKYLREQVDSLVAAAGKHGTVVHALVQHIFPAGLRHLGGSHHGDEWKSKWLQERRVAHRDVLRLYLERVVGEGLQSFIDSEKAWELMTDREALDAYLRSVPNERVRDVIQSLEAYEDQFRSEHVVPTSVVLLNLIPDLPDTPRGMFDVGVAKTVTRVVYRLVRSLKEPHLIEATVRQIIPQVRSLSSKSELLSIVGYRKDAGHKLIAESAARELEKEWRADVRAASPLEMAEETGLVWTLFRTRREAEPDEPPLVVPADSAVTRALLRSARSEVLIQTAGSRVVRRKPRLAWDALVELYGDETILRNRVQSLKADDPGEMRDLLELAEKYLAGWRPDEFEDE